MWKVVIGLLQYLPFWVFIQLMRFLKYDDRIKLGGLIVALTIRLIPKYRNRVFKNLELIYPNYSKLEKHIFLKDFSKNLGITFIQFLFNQEFHDREEIILKDSKQLDKIYSARRNKQPIIIVSGHFGPWEAVRAALKRRGIMTGAIYRKSKNRFYQPYHHKAISAGGTPIFQAGRKGTGEMIRYLKAGGIVCIMVDQAISDGHYYDFLGKPAKTTHAVANLALRYDALLIPAYAIRNNQGNPIEVIIESPIALTTPKRMTMMVNNSLTERIREHPTHWYWVHDRWK